MSVQIFRHCATPYWRYRGDHPKKGFCSNPCGEQHAEQRRHPVTVPDKPEVVMRRIKDHNRLTHDADSSMIAWDCNACGCRRTMRKV